MVRYAAVCSAERAGSSTTLGAAQFPLMRDALGEDIKAGRKPDARRASWRGWIGPSTKGRHGWVTTYHLCSPGSDKPAGVERRLAGPVIGGDGVTRQYMGASAACRGHGTSEWCPLHGVRPGVASVVLVGGPPVGSEWATPCTHSTARPGLLPPSARPASMTSAAAYDPAIGKLVLFGGMDGLFNVTGGTWTSVDGMTWTQQTPPTSPPARSGASMAYDPSIRQLVLFGGEGSSNMLGNTMDL